MTDVGTRKPVAAPRERLLAPAYAATTTGMFALIVAGAFEALAVTTVMPGISRDLDGTGLYALAFAAPMASGVVGMVAAGIWSDRSGPVRPVVAAVVVFCLGLLVCGLAPSMEVLVVGRIVQGLGSGAMTVCLYVLVGLVFPANLRAAVFASFAAAWVLPGLFGPALAAWIADVAHWRWVFLSVIGVTALALALIAPAARRARQPERDPASGLDQPVRLLWAVLAAVAVLAVELFGSHERPAMIALALVMVVLVGVAVRPLVPPGTLRAVRGLPAVIGTRGLLAGSFFALETYIAYVLQDHWSLSPTRAGLALTAVSIVWASASWLQGRLEPRVSDAAAMTVGALLVLIGAAGVYVAVAVHLPAPLAVAGYAVSGAGMGFGYPRTGVAMLAASTDADRGFNSSALSLADAMGAALALSLAGIAFTLGERGGGDPFLAVFALSVAVGGLGLLVASRTRSAG